MKKETTKEKILNKLSDGTFVSGQQIADALNISRTAVFKQIRGLKKNGFVIESVPKRGYKLKREAEKLYPFIINKYLKTTFIGRDLLHFEQVQSTINQVMLRAEKAKEGFTVVAERQIKGRGRFGRHWESERGGIWCSIFLKPSVPAAQAARLNTMAALAIKEGIKEITGFKAMIKWPNDIIVSGLKVAGILTEMNAELDKINFAVLSFGVNANNQIKDDLGSVATSLKKIGGEKINRAKLFCSILKKIEDHYKEWQNGNFGHILEGFKEFCITIGKKIEVKSFGIVLSGEAVGLDEEGRLILKTSDNKEHILSAGEVTIIN